MKDKGLRNGTSDVDEKGLVDAVFTWSIEDILNEDFFKDKVCISIIFLSTVLIFGLKCYSM